MALKNTKDLWNKANALSKSKVATAKPAAPTSSSKGKGRYSSGIGAMSEEELDRELERRYGQSYTMRDTDDGDRDLLDRVANLTTKHRQSKQIRSNQQDSLYRRNLYSLPQRSNFDELAEEGKRKVGNGIFDRTQATGKTFEEQGVMPETRDDVFHQNVYDYMSPEQKSTYYAFLGLGDRQSANRYLNSIEEGLQQQAAQKLTETIQPGNIQNVQDFADVTRLGVRSGIGRFETGVQQLGNPDAVSKNYTEMAFEEGRKNMSGVTGIVADLSNTVGFMLLPVGGSFALGLAGGAGLAASNGVKALSAALFGAASGGSTYNDVLREDPTGDKFDAKVYSIINGALEGSLQYLLGGIGKLGAGGLFKATGKSISGAVAKKLSNVAKASANTPAVKGLIKALVGGGKWAAGASDEALEEWLQAVLDPVMRNQVLGENNEVRLFGEDQLYAAFLGALGASVMNAPSNIGSTVNAEQVLKETVAKQEAKAAERAAKKNKTGPYTPQYTEEQIASFSDDTDVADLQKRIIKLEDKIANTKKKGLREDYQRALDWTKKTLDAVINDRLSGKNTPLNNIVEGQNEGLSLLLENMEDEEFGTPASTAEGKPNEGLALINRGVNAPYSQGAILIARGLRALNNSISEEEAMQIAQELQAESMERGGFGENGVDLNSLMAWVNEASQSGEQLSPGLKLIADALQQRQQEEALVREQQAEREALGGAGLIQEAVRPPLANNATVPERRNLNPAQQRLNNQMQQRANPRNIPEMPKFEEAQAATETPTETPAEAAAPTSVNEGFDLIAQGLARTPYMEANQAGTELIRNAVSNQVTDEDINAITEIIKQGEKQGLSDEEIKTRIKDQLNNGNAEAASAIADAQTRAERSAATEIFRRAMGYLRYQQQYLSPEDYANRVQQAENAFRLNAAAAGMTNAEIESTLKSAANEAPRYSVNENNNTTGDEEVDRLVDAVMERLQDRGVLNEYSQPNLEEGIEGSQTGRNIEVSEKLKGTKAKARAAMHEIGHLAARFDSKLVPDIIASMRSQGIDVDSRVEERRNQYREDFANYGLEWDENTQDAAYFEEEVAADFLGGIAEEDTETLNKIAAEQPGLIRRFIEGLKKIIGRLTGEQKSECEACIDRLNVALSKANIANTNRVSYNNTGRNTNGTEQYESGAEGELRTGPEGTVRGVPRRSVTESNPELQGARNVGRRNPELAKGVLALQRRGKGFTDLQEATSPEEFYDRIGQAKQTNSHGAFVTQHEIDEYAGMKPYLDATGTTGVAVTEDGNIVSVFKDANSSVKNAMTSILFTALDNGGKKLDNFNSEALSHMYAQHGFVPVARTAFVDEFAPDDWNYERDGRPDIVFWVHNGDSLEEIARNMGNYERPDYDSLPMFDDYDEAEAYRDSLIESNDNYMAAVNSGDMETAQRLVNEAAKKAGYTIKAYHGTTKNFTRFSRGEWGKNFKNYLELGGGFYFSPSQKEAQGYADRGSDPGKVMSVYLKADSIVKATDPMPGGVEFLLSQGLSEADAIFVAAKTHRFIDWLYNVKGYDNTEVQDHFKSVGIDAIDASYGDGSGQYVVFDPEQIKSADPVTYDNDGNPIPLNKRFNENNDDIRYSLKPKNLATESDEIDNNGVVLSHGQREYFRDSKARDEEGRLLTLYHGPATTTVFTGRPSTYGEGTSKAIYMTDNESVARQYGGEAGAQELYANITNPLILDAQGRNYTDIPIPDDAPQSLKDKYAYNDGTPNGTADADSLPGYAYDNGYDGIIIYNVKEYVGGEPMTEVIAFNSEQVKRTDNKVPTKSLDTRYSLAPHKTTDEKNLPKYTQENQEALESKKNSQYETEAMVTTTAEAREWLEKKGAVNNNGTMDYTKPYNTLMNKRGEWKPSEMTAGLTMFVDLAKTDRTAASALATKIIEQAPDYGRVINYFKILQKYMPDVVSAVTQSIANSMDVELTKEEKANIDLCDRIIKQGFISDSVMNEATGDFKEWLAEADDYVDRGMLDATTAAYAAAMTVVTAKKPATARQKFRSLQRISLLSNPKTHFRNILGNLAEQAGSVMSRPGADLTDRFLSRFTHQRTFGSGGGEAFAKAVSNSIEKAVMDHVLGTNTVGNKFDEDPTNRKGLEQLVQQNAWNENQTGALSDVKNGIAKVANNIDSLIGLGLSIGDAPFLIGTYEAALKQIMNANNLTEETATQEELNEAMDTAWDVAYRRTFRDSNAVTKALTSMRNSLPFIGETIAPYVQTPANVVLTALQYSPIGLGEAITKAFFDIGGVESLRTKLKNGESTMKVQRQIAELVGRGALGTACMLIGAMLAAAGRITGDDDDIDSSKEKNWNKAVGRMGSSIKVGDTYIDPSSLQSLSTPIMAGAAAYQSDQEEDDTGKFIDIIAAAAKASMKMGNTMLEMPVLQGVADLFSGNYDNGELLAGALSLAGNAAAQVVPFGSLLKQGAKAVDPYSRVQSEINVGPVERIAKSTANNLRSMTPWGRKKLSERYDVLGNPIKNDSSDNVAERLYNSFINPFNTSKDKSNDITEEIDRLYASLKDTDVLPSAAGNSISYGGEQYKFTSAEKQEYQRVEGESNAEILSHLVNSDAYNKLSDEDRAKVLESVYKYSANKAKAAYLDKQGVDYESDAKWMDSIDDIVKTGIDIGDAMVYRYEINNIEGSHDNQVYYIDSLPLNTDQKDALDEAFVDKYYPGKFIEEDRDYSNADTLALSMTTDSARTKYTNKFSHSWRGASGNYYDALTGEEFSHLFDAYNIYGGTSAEKVASIQRYLMSLGWDEQEAYTYAYDFRKYYDSKKN